MPTIVAALTLMALLKMAHVEMPRWHLAVWYGALITLVLGGQLPRLQVALNGFGSFLAAWLYFKLLERTDTSATRAEHYLVLVIGFTLLIGSRFWLDIQRYGITF